MRKTGNLAAYVAWIAALVAILTPPGLATAGIEMLTEAGTTISAAFVDEPDDLAVATLATEIRGWHG